MRRLLFITIFFSITLTGTVATASLSKQQARKLISRMAGARLPGDAVRVKRITETAGHADVTAEIETAFRFEQDKQGFWRPVEIRTGQDQWEELPLLAAGAVQQLPGGECAFADISGAGADLSPKRARCLLATLLGIHPPSDAVRIRDVSRLGLPFTSTASSLATAQILADVRFSKEKGGWRVTEMRAGNSDWIPLDTVIAALNDEKRKRAQSELAIVGRALENFRKDSGFYVISDKHPVLIDHLCPRYLTQVIRLDPWHRPYQYQGDRDHFSLRSSGPDGKENTSDDIVVTRPSPSAGVTKPLN